MKYTVTTYGMNQHITANNYSESFGNIDNAIKAFDYQCMRLEYDNADVNDDGTRSAGGIGHDYRIELLIEA